jgi:energy-coupling factor transporter ATP-binding protein EcfA2
MRLLAFNIQNYRSIIHLGWSKLAHDNITALIGQNESGKTSVLEALQSFYDGVINEDVLRSDLSLPVVHCRFDLHNKCVTDLLDHNRIPKPLLETLRSKNEFSLTRKWNEERKSIVFISDEDILNYYEVKELEKAKIEEKTQDEINNLITLADEIFHEMELAENEKEEAQKVLIVKRKEFDESQRTFNKAKRPDIRLIAEKEFALMKAEYIAAEEDFRNKMDIYEANKQKTQDISEKVSICKTCNESAKLVFEAQTEFDTLRSINKEAEHQYEISSNGKDRKAALKRLQQIGIDLHAVEKKYYSISRDDAIFKAIAAKIFSGQNYRQAEIEARGEIDQEKNYYTLFAIGEILFKYIPVFEFFEDFGSLLPNKIDLEDILNENTHSEGYKAARNFLQIAGLNAAFFRERNHRILKQKIENLNGEITINFQDYWSQNVGKNDRIKLNFELEHYDYTHPEKSGKPYLEFWIKDKQERLYPKQRSRGVRWFLSFYLELKATAKKNHDSRIMLIDEPGLSLHARAQEDVLKVFEDLKDKMQIVYCTHSPHLINLNKLYRILAVQRADEDDDRSETLIFDANSLYVASSDTLSPIYSLMGIKINNQNFILPTHNIIVEDTVCYYYLNAFYRLSGESDIPSFIPSTGLTNIQVLSNILLGWKVGFSILLMGQTRTKDISSELVKSLFISNETEMEKKILKLEKFEYPEDIFSTLDFKKFVLQKRMGITERNSEYILESGLSRTILASQFINYCEAKSVTINDFDDKTRNNINLLISKIKIVLT